MPVRSVAPDRHIEAAKRRVAHLGGLAAKTEAAERAILAAAEDRLQHVDTDLAKLRPRAVIDQDVGDQYQSLVLERGQLDTVIGRARQVLGA